MTDRRILAVPQGQAPVKNKTALSALNLEVNKINYYDDCPRIRAIRPQYKTRRAYGSKHRSK
jgi:hypothetical protein